MTPMEKLSVKKPYTVLVAVIMVLVLGVVSITGMTTDLLPEMSLPYLMVVTTYPGASPERVESDVVKPLEGALGTVSGVKNVYSTSSENYGMVQLEFEEDTNMDSTLVKVSSALQEAAASLPDGCGTPSIIELSMDMMATMYVSVSREGYDIYELSAFVKNTVQPYLERQNGVASISSLGLVEQNIQVELDQAKIDKLNATLLETVNESLAAAKDELDKAEQEVRDGKAELEKAQASFGSTMADAIFSQLEGTVSDTAAQLQKQIDVLLSQVTGLRREITDGETGKLLDSIILELESVSGKLSSPSLKAEDLILAAGSLRVIGNDLSALISRLEALTPEDSGTADLDSLRQQLANIESSLTDMQDLIESVPDMLSGLEDAYAGMTQAQLEAAVGFATASSQLSNAEAQLATAKAQYESAKEDALAKANLDQLLSVTTLSQMIYAQNFSMPAGYIDDKDDNSWLLKVGDEYKTVEELSGALLVSMEGIGDVRLRDVATVTVIDNAGESYARLNGEQAIILSIYKSSVAGTNETANNCIAAFDELQSKYEGTHLVTLMNQGSYIDMIIQSVLSSMITGALLAIVILALFLKDVKPTLVVGISIPLSVMFALVLMYFTGISLNMMTLSGLSLGIGMLVDNSVVVIENIYRLRSRGISAPRAAVQGTRQVAGSITSSTLTTICVFLPLVFTTGMVRELLLPLGLCIGYCLMASLIVAMTVVPASASTLLKNAKAKKHPLFDRFLNAYGKFLNWCLDHKAVPLTVSIGLLAVTVWAVLNMGIVLLPEMSGNQISVSVTTPEGITREESYAMADDVISLLLNIDGVDEVGVMDSASTTGMLGGMTSSNSTYGSYVYYIVLPEGTSADEVDRITQDINQAAESSPCTIEAASGGIDDLTAMFGSGLSLKIYGDDLETLEDLSNRLVTVVEQVEGYTDITTSFTDGEAAIHLVIDKDKAMAKGLTVAQIYMTIAEKMTTSATSTSVTLDGVTMAVTIENHDDPLTAENLLDIEFETSTMDSAGTMLTQSHKLSEFARLEKTTSIGSISRENQTRYVTVSAAVQEGYNATLLSRTLSGKLEEFRADNTLPYGYSIELEGESSTVNEMVQQMLLLLVLGCVFIYLVMVAQFQSLKSPFIVLFTVPLAFTGGMIGLLIAGQQLSLLSLMGFAVLMGTIVNNGIVFVDYVNQLRIGGMDRRSALIATGKTRMRPILMTALTTILAMFQMIFSDDMAGQLGSGMSIVIVGGLLYGTVMTLIIVPVIYDLLFKRQPRVVDIGSENLDDVPDDAAEFLTEALVSGQELPEEAEVAETEAGTEEAPSPSEAE